MEKASINDICAVIGGTLKSGDGDAMVGGFFTDSRKGASADGLFVPLRGENFDGHDFVADVAARAFCRGALVESGRIDALACVGGEEFAVIEVADALRAMQVYAAFNRALYSIPTVAVTGTVGKTTTKEFMRAAAGPDTVVSEGSFNNHIGVPVTLLNIGKDTRLCVAEVGTNAPGEIGALARLVRPTVAVITNVGPCHLEGLGSVANIAAEKACIIDAMAKGGKVLVNADCIPALEAVREKAREAEVEVLTFGFGKRADFRAVPVEGGFGLESGLVDGAVKARIALPGKHNVLNALAALAALVLAGRDAAQAAEGMAGVTAAKLRWERREAAGRTFILDCYNANPLSVRAALETFASEYPGRRKVFVFGDMYELGTDEKLLHAELADAVAESGTELFIAAGELAAETGRALARLGFDSANILFCADSAGAAALIEERSGAGDVVLVKGSRRNRMERIADSINTSCPGVRE